MGTAGATTNSRLSVDDSIQAGFAVLAEEGTKALKLDRLCARLAVTKGSFSWHFTDLAGYRAVRTSAARPPLGNDVVAGERAALDVGAGELAGALTLGVKVPRTAIV